MSDSEDRSKPARTEACGPLSTGWKQTAVKGLTSYRLGSRLAVHFFDDGKMSVEGKPEALEVARILACHREWKRGQERAGKRWPWILSGLRRGEGEGR